MLHRILARLDLPREQTVFDSFLILAHLLTFPIKLDNPTFGTEIQKKLEGIYLVSEEFQRKYDDHFRIPSGSCQPLVFVNKQVRETLLSIAASPFPMVKTLLEKLVPFFEEDEVINTDTLEHIFKTSTGIRNRFSIADSHLNLLADLPPYLRDASKQSVGLMPMEYTEFSYREPVWELTCEPPPLHTQYGFRIKRVDPGFDQCARYSQTYGIILNSIVEATNRHITITIIRHGDQWLLFKSNEVILFVDIDELLRYLRNTIFLTLSARDNIYYKFYLERKTMRDVRQ
jgi:hypothetical protein